MGIKTFKLNSAVVKASGFFSKERIFKSGHIKCESIVSNNSPNCSIDSFSPKSSMFKFLNYVSLLLAGGALTYSRLILGVCIN